MWVQKTASGKYQFCERYTDPLTGKKKKISVTYPDDKKATRDRAKFRLHDKIVEMLKPVKKATLTFGELSDQYIKYQEKNHKEQTAVSTENHLSRIRTLIGDEMLVEKLTPSYVRDVLNTGKPSLFNGRMKYIRSMIRWAYDEELIDSKAIADKVKDLKDYAKREKLKVKYLEGDELKTLLSGMAVEQWKLLTEFLVLSGLRIGEAMALKESDIYDREIHVERTFSLTTRKISSVKTDASYREVYIQDELNDCIGRIRAFHEGRKGDLLFRDLEGEMISYDAYNKYLRENTERILKHKLTPHALRHTHVALLAEHGMNLDSIGRRLGHSDSKITKDVYYHVTSKVKQRENEQMNGISLL